jgi:carbamoyl-phosphate synthase large subunit
VPIIGTSPDSIDRAEDRERFQQLIERLGLRQPPNGTARSVRRGVEAAAEIGYPLVVRPSYVLGGRAMEIVYDEEEPAPLHAPRRSGLQPTRRCCSTLPRGMPSRSTSTPSATASEVLIGGIMEHIEQAGVHSGDSACSLPGG